MLSCISLFAYTNRRVICACALFGSMLAVSGCGNQAAQTTPDGRVIVRYWEKWTGFEADAMRAVVDDFNASQDEVFVKMLSVSGVDQKLLLATAGGNPPDVAGLWTHTINVFAEKGALTPLDGYAADAGLSEADYIPAFWELCKYRGYLWARSLDARVDRAVLEQTDVRGRRARPGPCPCTIAELDEMA
ncbi:MAG: extracellular solute-binding protein [Phycisphaerales bacterium]